MNYEFNLLHHVGVVAKKMCAATAAAETAHEVNDNTPSGRKPEKAQLGPLEIMYVQYDCQRPSSFRDLLRKRSGCQNRS